MGEINIGYWFCIIIASFIQLCIFSKCFDNKKFKSKKGTFFNKAKYSVLVILIFIFPYIYTIFIDNFSNQDWFNIVKITIFLGLLIELFLSNDDNKLLSYKSLLMILSFYSLVILTIEIRQTFLLAILIISMDTCMSIFGRFIVSKISIEKIKLRYPESISKNKTGLSVILSYIMMLCIYSYFFDFWLITLVCFGTFLGDGIFSHYKRVNNVNDFSNLLGPIGGFADRFDGWIFTFIIVSLSGLKIATLGVAIFFMRLFLNYNTP